MLAGAAAQVVIIQAASTGAAKVTSSVVPIVVAALVIAWNISSPTPSRRDARASSQHRRPAPGVMLAWPCRSRAGVLCDGVNAAMKPPRQPDLASVVVTDTPTLLTSER